jgi:hypothetical protein
LKGFGRDRVLTVRVLRKGLETKQFWVLGRPGGHAISVPDINFGVYGPDMTIRLGPSRPLIGTVRDAKTGKPVAGAIVSEANHHIPRAVTDKDGRYRLEGVPKKPMYHLNVCGARGLPLFDRSHLGIKDVAGLDPLENDLTANRGVELVGRIVDENGKPVRAEVGYEACESNPNKPPIEPTVLSSDGWRTKPDGSFYVTGWPGKGVLWVFAHDAEKYATADTEAMLSKLDVRSRPVGGVHAIIPLDVDDAKPESRTVTIRLDLAKTRKGNVVGPEGQPLAGATAAGLTVDGGPKLLDAADFSMPAPRPGTTRLLVLLHEAKKLGAVVPVSGDSSEPVEIKLAPLGSVTGRVHRSPAEAKAGLTVTAIPDVRDARRFENLPTVTRKFQGTYGMLRGPWDKWTTRTTKTDGEGRFSLEGLLPGLTYTIHVSDGDVSEAGTLVVSRRGVTVEAGKLTELGDLKR